MIMEAIAAALVGLAVVALIIGPLTRPGVTAPPGADEPEDYRRYMVEESRPTGSLGEILKARLEEKKSGR